MTYKHIETDEIISGSEYNSLPPYKQKDYFPVKEEEYKDNDIVDDIIDIGIGVGLASLFNSDNDSSSSDSSSSSDDSGFGGFDGGDGGGGGASGDW